MKNLLIFNFESGPMVPVFKKLEEDNIISIKRWIYDENVCDEWFYSSPIARSKTSFWRGEWEKRNEFPSITINNKITVQMDWIMQEIVRESDFFREFYYEYKNIINHMVNEYFYEILNNHIDIVVFSDIPHNHIAALLYMVAKAMNKDTIFTMPLHYLFPNKFIYSYSMEDYGSFSRLKDYHSNVPEWHTEKKFKKNFAYMSPEQIKKDKGKDWKRKLKFFRNPVKWAKERKATVDQNFAKYDSTIDFIERKAIQFITRHVRNRIYNKNLQRFAAKNVDMNRKFVYVPLHLQPEMTVDTIGGIYRDQILVVEKVRNIIPDDWYIYVKENPKQLAIARDKFFFKRLNAIPNTIFIDSSINTYDLLEKSQFVATITGTAAWESITGGKPALFFGHQWFETFPGIVHYHENLKLEEIINYRFEHHDLEKAVENFTKKLCDGVWLPADINSTADYDEEKNFNELYNSLKFILQG